MLGVVPTMLTLYGGAPVQANQYYIDQVKNLQYYLFPALKENATVYAHAPNDGVPVILSDKTNTPTGAGIVEELTKLGEDVAAKVGI